MTRQLFLVLGSGRCGTSMVMEALSRMRVGVSTNLKPADPANLRGYWEDTFVVGLHRRLLQGLGAEGKTGAAMALAPDWQNQPAAIETRRQLAEHLAAQIGDNQKFAVKDPRLCVLLPMWLSISEHLELRLRCILVMRNPANVAQSIQQVSRLPPVIGEAIWLNRVAHALVHAPLPIGIVHYEDFRNSPAKAGEDLASIVTTGPKNIASAAKRAQGAIKRNLQTASLAKPVSSPFVESLYRELRDLSGVCENVDAARAIAEECLNSSREPPGWPSAAMLATEDGGQNDFAELDG